MKIQYVDKQGVETILKLLKNKISSIVDAVVFRGTVNSVADLPLLSDADIKPGDMYTVLTESQTTADFVEGAGETIDPYTEVVVVNQGTVLNPEYKWYVLGNVFTTKDKISYGQSLPSMPYDGMLFFYMGPDVTTAGNELYSNSFYAYNESENTWDYLWTLDDKIWRGTQAEWDALSAAEKDKYEQAEIIGLDNNGVVYVADKIEEGNMNPVTSNAVAIGRPEYYNKQLTVEAYEQAQLFVTSAYLRGQKVVCKDGKTRIFGKIIMGGAGNPNGEMNRHPCKLTGFPGPVTLLNGRLPCLIWSGWTGFYSMDNIANGVFAPIVAGPGHSSNEEACFTPQEVVVEVTE